MSTSGEGAPHGAAAADVCLVLEGTYPYVLGGVSAWVHHLVRDLSHLTFHVWYIGADDEALSRDFVYTLPPNVIGLDAVPLLRKPAPPRAFGRMRRGAPEFAVDGWAGMLPDLISALLGRGRSAFGAALARRARIEWPAVPAREVLAHPRAYAELLRVYEAEASHEAFETFFWTWVSSLTPVLELLSVPVPPARLYHTVSTGYAGLLAARARYETGRPMLLTEHGIYTKERRVEIGQARWIECVDDGRELASRRPPYFRRWWNRMFEGMSHVAYAAAEEILTIHQGNTALQLADGADQRKLRVISNGIDAARIRLAADAAAPRAAGAPFTIGFVGRVAPIKDLETLLDALALVRLERPDAVLRILGPTAEDADYVARCERHAERLGLVGAATFEGPVDVAQELPTLDVMVLTSISEAQPLVLLEAGAAGVPVVATEVGACRELVHGRAGADRGLGASGLLTPIGSPRATADALLRLARDPALRARMGAVGRERVTRFYGAGEMLEGYDEVYRRLIATRMGEAA
ncbi:MAG: GT4 family glycosyltransferase PelF [Planctomycetota bacterium]